MRQIINTTWQSKMHEAISDYHARGLIPAPQVFTWNTSAKWYIKVLVENRVPFKVLQRGGGVKEVVIEHHRCEACMGKGYTED
jgi:hypothetical protein